MRRTGRPIWGAAGLTLTLLAGCGVGGPGAAATAARRDGPTTTEPRPVELVDAPPSTSSPTTTTSSTTTTTTTTTTAPPTTTTTTAPPPPPPTTTTAPPPPPPPTTAAPVPLAGGGCDPNYTGCVPIDPVDVDCSSGSGNGPSYARGPVTVIGVDIYGLDRDGDGIGCEDG